MNIFFPSRISKKKRETQLFVYFFFRSFPFYDFPFILGLWLKESSVRFLCVQPDTPRRKQEICAFSFELQTLFLYFFSKVDEEDKEWPNWVELISNFSHLAIVFNSSVNFYIYFAKHWRAILNIPESRASNQTELTRIRTSVVAHNFNHRNSHTYHPSAPAISEQMDKIPPPSSSKLTVPNGNGKTNLDANQTENATEDTRMLVNVIVSAPQDYNNGDVNA